MGKTVCVKFNGVINDDTLPTFGKIILRTNTLSTIEDSSVCRLNIIPSAGNTVKVSVEDNHYFARTFSDLTNHTNLLSSITLENAADNSLYFEYGVEYNIFIENTYNIGTFSSLVKSSVSTPNKRTIPMTTADIREMYNVSELNFGNWRGFLTGNISELESLELLQKIAIGATSVSGDIKSFGKLKNIDYISIYSTQIGGTLEGMIDEYVNQGKTTGSIGNTGTLGQATFGGVVREVSASVNGIISWSGTNKILYGLGDYISIDNCSTIYAKGATAEEIAAWEQAGKTVIVVN